MGLSDRQGKSCLQTSWRVSSRDDCTDQKPAYRAGDADSDLCAGETCRLFSPCIQGWERIKNRGHCIEKTIFYAMTCFIISWNDNNYNLKI